VLKLQYVLSLAIHWFLRRTGAEDLLLALRRRACAAYLDRQGLGHLLDEDVSYGTSLMTVSDRTKVIDLARLHRLVKGGRYKSIREYGAGASTIAIAHAMALSGRTDITLVTIDESQEWLQSVLDRLDPRVRPQVNGVVARYVRSLTPLSDGGVECDLVLEQSVPCVPDLVYVDGPTLHALKDNVRGTKLSAGWREPINVDAVSVAHTMRKGSVIIFDERSASYWATVRALRRPFFAWSSSLYSVNRITVL
jgi:hypothetical protein